MQDEQSVRDSVRVDVLLLPPTTVVSEAGGATSRAYVAAGALGLMLLVIVPFAADAVFRRRQRIRA
jgi:hypothetical protein